MAILRIARFWPAPHGSGAPARAAGTDVEHSVDGLDAFGSEAAEAVRPAEPPSPPAHSPVWLPARATVAAALKWAAVVTLTAVAAVGAVLEYQRRTTAGRMAVATLKVETVPGGLEVAIAGKTMGRTPIAMSLRPGKYDVQLGSAAERRTISVDLAAGTSIVQHVEMAAPVTAAANRGALAIQTEPPRLKVLLDGVERGMSPITIEGIEAGNHEVSVRGEHGVLRRSVRVPPHATVSLIVSTMVSAPALAGGWLAVSSPVALQLREDGKLIGTSAAERIMLPAGDHRIEMVDETLGFREERRVRIEAGKTSTTRVDLPNGTLSINAQPWAEVWVDGDRIGETPIGNLAKPIGTHQIVLKNPDFGERHETVVITLGRTARLGVDMRKK